jgi:hypothetical protein
LLTFVRLRDGGIMSMQPPSPKDSHLWPHVLSNMQATSIHNAYSSSSSIPHPIRLRILLIDYTRLHRPTPALAYVQACAVTTFDFVRVACEMCDARLLETSGNWFVVFATGLGFAQLQCGRLSIIHMEHLRRFAATIDDSYG